MALSGDTNPGFAAVNSEHKKCVFRTRVRVCFAASFSPFTALHKVGIVASYSYSEIVKPKRSRIHQPSSMHEHRGFERTIHLLLILHDQERVKV